MSDRNWILPTHERRMSVGVTAAEWRHIDAALSPLQPKTEWLHLDVIDGVFCPKLTFGAWLVPALPETFVLDVHIMTANPLQQAKAFVAAGAHVVTMQYEALDNAIAVMQELKDLNVIYRGRERPIIRGISLCPTTNLDVLDDLLPHVEIVQLLTLDPRDGSKMEPQFFADRLSLLNKKIDRFGGKLLISVDGSMTLDIAVNSANQGANLIVSGSALFKNNQLEENLSIWRSKLDI